MNMKKSIINFLKADLRMPQLMFWDWLFPLIIVIGLSLFMKGTETSIFLFPGLVSLLILQSIIFSIPYRLAQYSERGILKLIKEKGNISKMLLSFYISRALILFIQIFLVIAFGKIALQITLDINWFVLILAVFFSITIFLLIATIIGLLVKTQNSALGIAQAVYFLSMAASGVLYPIEQSPELLKTISGISPLTHVTQLWKKSLLGTQGTIGSELVILVITLILFILVLAIMLRSVKGGMVHENRARVREY